MTTYTTEDIYTDMIGEFPTEIEDFGADLIRAAYSAYRQGLGTFWQSTYEVTEGEDIFVARTFYASYRAQRNSHNEFAHVTVVSEDGNEQGYRVRFVARVDNRHPEYASVEEW